MKFNALKHIRDLRRAVNAPMQSWGLNLIGTVADPRVATPAFSPVAGGYVSTQNVTIT